jgi:Tfp pilus assembly protein PilF
MEGRRSLTMGLVFLIAAGCQHQEFTTPNMGSFTSPNPQAVAGTPVIKRAQPTKDLPAPVLTSRGDLQAGEAMSADVPREQQQQIREMARQDYEKALKLDPKYVPAYLGLARLHSTMNDPQRAMQTYQKALQIAPNNAVVWFELGMCHNAQKNYGPAADCLGRAAQLDSGNRAYGNALGVVLAQAGRYDESLQCFIRSSGEGLGYYRLAQTLQRMQKPDLSQRYMAMALQKDPNLAASLAMKSGANPTTPPVQQTSYPGEPAPTTNLPANGPPKP